MTKTLRDEFAMSLDPAFIPKLNDEAAIKLVAEKLGLEYDPTDAMKMIEFAFKYQSMMRYQFADEMLNARGI